MGCSSSKGLSGGSSAHRRRPGQQQQVQPPPYSLPQQLVPASTLPPGWISQFDVNKQRLFYVYPQTGQTTWEHPNGPAADAQEMARFFQIQELQRQQFGQHGQTYDRHYMDSYNRMGGMGPGASLAMGALAGGAAGLLAGELLMGGLHGGGYYGGGYYGGGPEYIGAGDYGGGYGGDVIPAQTDFGGGDFGGGDFGGGDFGGF